MVDPGFDPAEKLTMRVTLPGTDYDESWERNEFFTETLNRLELVPGVTSATVISHLPMSGSNWAQSIRVEETEPDPEGRLPISNRRAVSPGYFTQMGIPMLRGRDFGEYVSEGTPRVVIINERMAERFWPGEDPLGRRIAFAAEPAPGEWVEVVGVVGVGIGRSQEGHSMIEVLVDRLRPEHGAIPEEIDGVPIRVRVTGVPEAKDV